MLKKIITLMAISVGLSFSAASFATTCTTGQTLGIDPYVATTVKLMRPTGTNNVAIVTTAGTVTLSSSSSCGGWSSIVSGNAKVWQSYDGAQGAGNTATAGLDAGYDAVAFIRINAISIVGDPSTKCATYLLPGGATGTLCTTGYLDWIFSRP